MQESIKQICQEIKSAKVEYKVTIDKEIEHHPVLIYHQAFASLKEKITLSAVDIVSKELNFAKIVVENFHH